MNKKGEISPFIIMGCVILLLIGMMILFGINEFYRQTACKDDLGMEFKHRNEEAFDYCVNKQTWIAYPVIIEETGWLDYEAQIIQVDKHIVEIKEEKD